MHEVVIKATRIIQTSEVSRFAWSALRRFQNPAFVCDLLCEMHALPARYRPNALKQAEQIRYCIMQAKEYHDASRVVSLATKPVMLYYSLMNLAIAEILFKQSGDSSLDRAREQHRHHGLTFAVDASVRQATRMVDSMTKVSASPALRKSGVRYGTFKLWLDSCRSHPLCADINTSHGTSHITRFGVYGVGRDESPPVALGRTSLLECFQNLPSLRDFSLSHRLEPATVRASMSLSINYDSRRSTVNIRIHPVTRKLYETFISNLVFKPDHFEGITLDDNGNHGTLTIVESIDSPIFSIFPPSVMKSKDEIIFWSRDQPLNEFGYFYLSLFMCSNYARYYPDYWIKDIERSSEIIVGVDALLHSAEERVPLLAASELEQTYLVPGN